MVRARKPAPQNIRAPENSSAAPFHITRLYTSGRCVRTPKRAQPLKLGVMATASSFRTRFHEAVRTLSPGYFALVMGSGIVSVGLHLQEFSVLSMILLVVCAGSYVVLLALTAGRKRVV